MKNKCINLLAVLVIIFTVVLCTGNMTAYAADSTSANLPSNYNDDIDDVASAYPGTRSQLPYSTCWAFAATACAEFDMVKNHGVSKSNADYSELQLLYFHYNTGNVLEGLEGDSTFLTNAGDTCLTRGANLSYAIHTLSQWKCYTKESNLPYSKVVNNAGASIDPKFSEWHGSAKFRGAKIININTDPASVKKAIMEYGAVLVTYHDNISYFSVKSGDTYYYNPNDYATNHDVVLVGWNDNISREKWPADNRPSSNGAWLVRNSGTTDPARLHSNQGYFYMSYDEASLADKAYALDFEPNLTADNLYQHDGAVASDSISSRAAASVFTAHENMSSSSEKIDSVVVSFTNDSNLQFKVDIYTDLKNNVPDSGRHYPSATTTGSVKEPGIYTIDLKEPVYLRPGEKFAVVVTSTNGEILYDVERKKVVTANSSGGTVKPWFTTECYAEQGESYIYGSDSWIDVTKYTGSKYDIGNIRIKAIAIDSTQRKCEITYRLNGGTNASGNPDEYVSRSSGAIRLKDPARSGYHFCGWYSDSAFKNRVTSISYSEKKDHTLYARWCSNSNPTETVIVPATLSLDGTINTVCSKCGSVFAMTAFYKPDTIELSNEKFVYSGSQQTPEVIVKDGGGKTLVPEVDYLIKYNQTDRKNVGRYSVTVNFTGKYEGSKTLYYSVLPKAPASATAVGTGYNSVKVEWSKCTGASGYTVYYKKTSSTAAYKNYKNTTNCNITIDGLANNAEYSFKIVPYYKSGETRYRSTESKIVKAATIYRPGTIKLSYTKTTYSGKQKSPAPVIKTAGDVLLINGADYKYSYNKATRKSVGRYTVTIKYMGAYHGSTKLYFMILPKAPASAKAVRYGHDDIKVSWSSSKGASGYYVYYKLSSSDKYSLLKRTTGRSVKAANLKDGKTYNFKVVPYYKNGDTRYKSLDSKLVSCKTLKK